MSAEDRFSRATFLMGQSRYDMAEVELRKTLSDDPDNATTHAILAICLSHRGRYQEALDEAQTAVGLAPDDSFSFYALASAHIVRERWKEAEAAIVEAIRLDPFDEDNFAVQSRVLAEQNKWRAALEAAEEGLALDPEHVKCLNNRALALRNLSQDDSAIASLQTAMQHEPEDSYTHSNVGWGHLRDGNHEQAMVHFREALRLEPEYDDARSGMLAVLRARNPFYRVLLPALFWLSKQTTTTQYLLAGVGVAVYIALDKIGDSSPSLAVWVRPIKYLFMACVWMTWIAEPLLNLLVRASREGRRFLSDNDIQKANWCAIFIVPGLVFFCLALIFNSDSLIFRASILMCLVIVVAEVFDSQNPWVRTRMTAYAVASVALGMLGLLLLVYAPYLPDSVRRHGARVGFWAMIVALVGCLAADEVAKWLTRNAPYRE